MQQPQQNTFGAYFQLQRPQQQQQQQQQQASAQPIRLAHPTRYHVEQRELRNRREQASSNDGAPPTPNNSYTNTIDPGLLSNFQQNTFIPHHIKQESNSPDIVGNDFEFGDPSSNIMSPLSNSPLGSPPNNNTFDDEYVGSRSSYKAGGNATVHIDTTSQLGESPGTQPSIYSPGADTTEFLFDNDFSTSAPTSTAAMDMKPMTKFNLSRIHANNGFNNQVQPISMSVPVYSSSDQPAWFNAGLEPSSFAGHSTLQFGSGTEISLLGTDFVNAEDEGAEKRNLMYEKRRRRRESHNAVERRRRDNINEKIQELSTLLPDLYNDSTNKPNKGMILTKSVNYIRNLKQNLDQETQRIQELEAMVRDLQSKLGNDPNGQQSLGDDDQSSMNMMP